ncbi:MAG TPA: HAD family phosphatase [Natronosporangium sp.]
MLKAVLFDLDGTLVDNVSLWREALSALMVARQGHPVAGAVDGLRGTSVAEAVATVGRRLGWPASRATMDEHWVVNWVRDRYHAGVPWREGAHELVAAARARGLKTALVTASSRELVEAVRKDRHCPDFDELVTGDDVTATKPAPEPYRTAAEWLECEPEHCLAVEDSPVGVASALSAGCFVIAVGPDALTAETAGADPARLRCVETLAEIRLDEIQLPEVALPGIRPDRLLGAPIMARAATTGVD